MINPLKMMGYLVLQSDMKHEKHNDCKKYDLITILYLQNILQYRQIML